MPAEAPPGITALEVITHPVDERVGDCADNPSTPRAHPNRGLKVKHEDDDLQIAWGPCEQKLSAGSWDEMVKTMTKQRVPVF
jgi:hypothetical protein